MCFSLSWVENLLIGLVILIAVVALLKLVVAYVLPALGGPFLDVIAKAVNIVIWAVVAIAVIIFIFDLISCLVGGGMSLRIR